MCFLIIYIWFMLSYHDLKLNCLFRYNGCPALMALCLLYQPALVDCCIFMSVLLWLNKLSSCFLSS